MEKKRTTPFLALASLMLTSQPTIAESEVNTELRVKFGGWSKHFHDLPDITKERIDYNETHRGVGIEYMVKNSNMNTYKSIGMMYMRDSYKKPAFTFGGAIGYYADFWADYSVSAGVIAGFQDRSYIEMVNDVYVDSKRIIVPFVAPEFTFSYRNLGISTVIFPHVMMEDDEISFKKPVVFTQLFYNF